MASTILDNKKNWDPSLSFKVYDYLTMLDNSKLRKRVNITLFPVLFLTEADLEILQSEFLIAVFMEIQIWSDVTVSSGEKVPAFRRIGCFWKVGNLPKDTVRVYHVIRTYPTTQYTMS